MVAASTIITQARQNVLQYISQTLATADSCAFTEFRESQRRTAPGPKG